MPISKTIHAAVGDITVVPNVKCERCINTGRMPRMAMENCNGCDMQTPNLWMLPGGNGVTREDLQRIARNIGHPLQLAPMPLSRAV